MKFAAGAWLFVMGYALIYTGVAWFVGGTAVSLASTLGITSLQPSTKAVQSAVAPTTTPTASTLPSGYAGAV